MCDALACAPAEENGDGVPVTREQSVVYGEDDRLEVFEHPEALYRQRAVESNVALFSNEDIAYDEEGRLAIGEETAERRNLCEGERFGISRRGLSVRELLLDATS